MKKDLCLVVLVALVLALIVPLANLAWHSEKAFTYDNLIIIQTAANRE